MQQKGYENRNLQKVKYFKVGQKSSRTNFFHIEALRRMLKLATSSVFFLLYCCDVWLAYITNRKV